MTASYETVSARPVAVIARTCSRFAGISEVQLDPDLPASIANRSPLAQAWRTVERTLDDYVDHQTHCRTNLP